MPTSDPLDLKNPDKHADGSFALTELPSEYPPPHVSIKWLEAAESTFGPLMAVVLGGWPHAAEMIVDNDLSDYPALPVDHHHYYRRQELHVMYTCGCFGLGGWPKLLPTPFGRFRACSSLGRWK